MKLSTTYAITDLTYSEAKQILYICRNVRKGPWSNAFVGSRKQKATIDTLLEKLEIAFKNTEDLDEI